jgi:cephalosporin hydroxylase
MDSPDLDPEARDTIARFHELFYGTGDERLFAPWHRNRWLGVPTLKCPFDLWIYQELLFLRRPDVVIESGTAKGGSTYFLASILDMIGSGRVVTVDIVPQDRPAHPRITYLTGSSTDPEIVATVRESIGHDERVMVILDSDHSRDHVLSEMRTYGPLVSKGQYLIVEDTNVNGHPVFPEHGPGPMEAVRDFVAEQGEDWQVDESRERLLLTFNPGGYLRRVRPVTGSAM